MEIFTTLGTLFETVFFRKLLKTDCTILILSEFRFFLFVLLFFRFWFLYNCFQTIPQTLTDHFELVFIQAAINQNFRFFTYLCNSEYYEIQVFTGCNFIFIMIVRSEVMAVATDVIDSQPNIIWDALRLRLATNLLLRLRISTIQPAARPLKGTYAVWVLSLFSLKQMNFFVCASRHFSSLQ